MARHKRRRSKSFWGLGNVEGSRALAMLVGSLKKCERLVSDVKRLANADPLAAIRAEAEAQKALVDAKAFAKSALASGVYVPSDYTAAITRAEQAVGSLAPVISHASSRYNEMRQVDPEWPERDYGFPTGRQWFDWASESPRDSMVSSNMTRRSQYGVDGLGGRRRRARRSGGRCRGANGHFKRCR